MQTDRIQLLDGFYLESTHVLELEPELECGLCSPFYLWDWEPAFLLH